jgi:RNA polymerase sigma-70 factor (ECF subfamily)
MHAGRLSSRRPASRFAGHENCVRSLLKLREQNKEWFEHEVVALLPALYGTAVRLARNTADAEDLVADAVAKAWQARGSLQEASSFRGWLFRILMNTFLSDCRSRASEPAVETLLAESEEGESFSLFEKLHQPFLLWWGNPEQDFLNRLLRQDIENAVERLPVPYRMVVLAELQGLSYQEIAEALEIPVGTVRSRLARGRGMLQKALWKHAIDAGLVHAPARGETQRTS